jgi:hypothetical protein
MRFNKLSIGAAMLAGTVLALSAGAAQADEHWDHRDHDRWEHHDRYRDHYERPVIVHERAPVIVERERPVYVAPPIVYPMAPQGPSGLNLNFNIPLQ